MWLQIVNYFKHLIQLSGAVCRQSAGVPLLDLRLCVETSPHCWNAGSQWTSGSSDKANPPLSVSFTTSHLLNAERVPRWSRVVNRALTRQSWAAWHRHRSKEKHKQSGEFMILPLTCSDTLRCFYSTFYNNLRGSYSPFFGCVTLPLICPSGWRFCRR